ncbi:MAG: chain-length determining protein [Nostocales cyanobacterium]|nr:MAG: chain-length determining protein [Nostocales cyanobacterium]TAF19877.1 MAG: chain-length determining protein [Nostocales cyanobacterium]
MNRKKLVTTSKKSVFDLQTIATILFYRRFLILGVSCAVMSTTSLLAVVAKPMYQSSMQIMVKDNLEPELSFDQSPKNGKSKPDNFNISVQNNTSQMQLMVSSKLVEKAVNLLRADYPKITVDDIKGNADTGKQSFLNIRFLEESYQNNLGYSQVFLVSFKDPDPIKTQRVLQALQKVYQDYNIEQKNQQLQQGLAFVNNRLPNLQRQTLAAEKKLEIFRKKYNFINPELQGKVLLESLSDLQKQRKNIHSQLEDIENSYKSVEQKLVATKQDDQLANSLSRSSRYQALVNEIRSTEMNLARERLRYTDNSPIIVNLEEKRKLQMTLLEAELKQPAINNNQSEISSELTISLGKELKQLDTQKAELLKNDNALAANEKQLRRQLNTYPSLITEYNRLLSEVKLQQKSFEKMVELQNSLGMKIAQGGFDLQVLEEPDLGIYIGTKKWLLIISGVVLGPFIGVFSALILEMFKRVIISPLDIQRLTNIRLLGSVPKLKNTGNKFSIQDKLKRMWQHKQNRTTSGIIEPKKSLSTVQNLDMIYQNLQIFKHSLPLKSLTLTSSLPGEGKTTVALGLAASAANMHQRVLVIDANLRSPNLHKILGLTNDWGLSLLLLDDITTQFKNYIQPIHPSIDVLTAGETPDDIVSLLSSGRLKELVKAFEEIYDLVIIDTSSVLDSVDARIIASVSDGIVIVGKIGQLSPQELMETTEILSQLNLIGIIANEVYNSASKTQSTTNKEDARE